MMNLEKKSDLEKVKRPEKKTDKDPWEENIRFIQTTSLGALIAMNQKDE